MMFTMRTKKYVFNTNQTILKFRVKRLNKSCNTFQISKIKLSITTQHPRWSLYKTQPIWIISYKVYYFFNNFFHKLTAFLKQMIIKISNCSYLVYNTDYKNWLKLRLIKLLFYFIKMINYKIKIKYNKTSIILKVNIIKIWKNLETTLAKSLINRKCLEFFHIKRNLLENTKINIKYNKLILNVKKTNKLPNSLFDNLIFIDNATPGTIFWIELGWLSFCKICNFIRRIVLTQQTSEINTPQALSDTHWKISGHVKHFKNEMFYIKNTKLILRPMNCIGHIITWNRTTKTCYDLPTRIFELGKVFRNEYSGSLSRLMRLKSFTQDDTHIFINWNQATSELLNSSDLTLFVYNALNIKNVTICLSKAKRRKSMLWNKSLNKLKFVMKILKIKYSQNAHNKLNILFDKDTNQGAFYASKIEFKLNYLNKQWQCGTLQLDFSSSRKFKLFYYNEWTIKIWPILIHRALTGSIERFIGILSVLKQTPLWVFNNTISIIPIEKKYLIDAFIIKSHVQKDIQNQTNANIKIESSQESLSKKIKINNNAKIIILLGKLEQLSNSISIKIKGIKLQLFLKLNELTWLIKKLNC